MTHQFAKWPWAWTILIIMGMGGNALGVEPGAGVNAAGIIEFPTALDQTQTHVFHGTLQLVDVGEPDLRLSNFRYGLQLGNFQLLTDVHGRTEPDRDFDYAEIRAKLRVLPLDEIRTNIAIGLMGRYADDAEGETRIDDNTGSLFAVVTTQAFLFGKKAMLFNFYLDNLSTSFGMKVETFQFIQAVGELNYLHSQSDALDRTYGRLGIEIEGEQNFYFQLFYSDRHEDFMVQIGSGF